MLNGAAGLEAAVVVLAETESHQQFLGRHRLLERALYPGDQPVLELRRADGHHSRHQRAAAEVDGKVHQDGVLGHVDASEAFQKVQDEEVAARAFEGAAGPVDGPQEDIVDLGEGPVEPQEVALGVQHRQLLVVEEDLVRSHQPVRAFHGHIVAELEVPPPAPQEV